MVYDVRRALTDPDKAVRFAAHLIDGYLTPAYGSRSKSEIDILVFEALVKAGALNVDGPIYDLARTFSVTPAKARALVLNWQLRSAELSEDLKVRLIEVLQKTRFAKDGTLLTFGIESPLLKEEVIARLKAKGIFADASFGKDLVRLPVEAFVEFLDDLVEPAVKDAVARRLVADKQLPDKGFKALATGVLGKLGEKIAGKVGEEVAGALVGAAADIAAPATERIGAFLVGLLSGNVDNAVGAVGRGEFAEAV